MRVLLSAHGSRGRAIRSDGTTVAATLLADAVSRGKGRQCPHEPHTGSPSQEVPGAGLHRQLDMLAKTRSELMR